MICFPKMEQKAERNGTMWNAFFPAFTYGLYIKLASKYLYLKEGSKPAWKDFFKAALPLSSGSKMYVCMTNGFCPGSEVADGHSRHSKLSLFYIGYVIFIVHLTEVSRCFICCSMANISVSLGRSANTNFLKSSL